MKNTILLFVIAGLVNEARCLERPRMLTRTQLRMHQVQVEHEATQKWRRQAKHDGMRTILECLPICAIGVGLYLNSLYRLSNLEKKCWVQPSPPITQEECNLWKQCVCGAALFVVPSLCIGKGCYELCQAQICTQDNWCRECCTLCTQECCWLLGMNHHAHDRQ